MSLAEVDSALIGKGGETMDREQVIKGLYEICAYFRDSVNAMRGGTADCTVFNGWAMTVADALALLKEQEAVEPKLVGVNTWTCGKCGALLGWEEFAQSGLELVKYKYCPECGKAVKWDE